MTATSLKNGQNEAVSGNISSLRQHGFFFAAVASASRRRRVAKFFSWRRFGIALASSTAGVASQTCRRLVADVKPSRGEASASRHCLASP